MRKVSKALIAVSFLSLFVGCTQKVEKSIEGKTHFQFLNDLTSIQSSNGQVAVPSYNSVGLLAPGAGPGAGANQKPCASRPGKAHPDQGSGVCSGNNYFEVDFPTTGLSLSYNSQSNKIQLGFGFGFSLSIDDHYFSNASASQYYLVQGDGSIISHHKSKEGEWVSDDFRLVQSVFQSNGAGLIQLLPEGERAEFSLFSSSNGVNHYVVSKLLDRNGNATQIIRNAEGLITEISDPYGNKVTISYTNGLAVSLQDNASSNYALSYDASKRLIALTQPDGRTSTFAYGYNDGLVTEKKSADGRKLVYTYYLSGDLETIKNDLGYLTVVLYEPNVVKVKTSFDAETEKFDPQGRIISYKKNALETVFTRDANGLLVSEKDPLGLITSYTYASTNGLIDPRPASITYPNNGGTVTVLQAGGLRPYPPSKVTRTQGSIKSVSNFDVSHGGVVSEVNGLAGQDVINYTYDAKGNLLTVGKNALLIENYTYDALGRVLSETDAKGLKKNYSYAANGEVSSETDPFGRVTSYQHDLLGNVIQTITPTHKISQDYNVMGDEVGKKTIQAVAAGGAEASVTVSKSYHSNGALSSYASVKSVSNEVQSSYEASYDSIPGQTKSRTLKNASGESYNLDQ